MNPPKHIANLVDQFHEHRDAYHKGKYNETQLRVDYLDPLFSALGWDVHNNEGYAEAYRDVIHEDQIKVGTGTKAPDYCFRIGGTRKFFVEAKKPSVDIKGDETPAYQIRRYAWSAKLPLSILTDFEEFAVYDCRVEPKKGDKASKARVKYFTFDKYADEWEYIHGTFSREAVLKGRFDKFAESNKKKRGTSEVDDAFLEEIEEWRDLLARNIALRNPEFDIRTLNDAVQRTIDRIIFLRIAEDRGFENYKQLHALMNGGDVYARLTKHFKEADARYNSGLFHFSSEPGRDNPDRYSLTMKVDDDKLKHIIKRLYYPESPYEFSVLPADILGQVYEQFLGKVITLTPNHRAKVEEKPEVKKAGGVYYTPTYIVDYIVKHTIGELVKDKSPEDIMGKGKGNRPLTVLDPACGSGSFLLGAYQFLLDWFLEQYKKDTKKYTKGKAPRIFQFVPKNARAGDDATFVLTLDERKRILIDHVYGVDIDAQAVEVTKLSLLLKVLETEDMGQQVDYLREQTKKGERVLPDLVNNIKCGNSLIGPDFYENQQLDLTQEDHYRINAFDWHSEFKHIFQDKNPGFDAVIGNPPYVRIQTLKTALGPPAFEFIQDKYETSRKGNFDIYVVFVERGCELLGTNGYLGFIIPNKFFTAKYAEGLRSILSSKSLVREIVSFGDQQVFGGATTYTTLLFLNSKPKGYFQYTAVSDLQDWQASKSESLVSSSVQGASNSRTISSNTLGSSAWNLYAGPEAEILERLTHIDLCLGDIARLFVGLQTDADDVFIVERIGSSGEDIICRSKYTEEEHSLEGAHLKPLLKGSVNIGRYELRDVTKHIIFPYENSNGRSVLLSSDQYASRWPKTWKYLNQCRDRLASRDKGRMDENWYGYVYKKNHTRMDSGKLVVPSLAKGSAFSADFDGEYFFVGSGGGGGGGYGVTTTDDSVSLSCLLSILNSKLISLFIRTHSTPFRGGYFALNKQYIEQIPLVIPKESSRKCKLESMAQRMLDLHAQLKEVKTTHDQKMIKRQIENTDNEIDRLVYDLYGLTDAEIKIIEAATQT